MIKKYHGRVGGAPSSMPRFLRVNTNNCDVLYILTHENSMWLCRPHPPAVCPAFRRSAIIFLRFHDDDGGMRAWQCVTARDNVLCSNCVYCTVVVVVASNTVCLCSCAGHDYDVLLPRVFSIFFTAVVVVALAFPASTPTSSRTDRYGEGNECLGRGG